MNDGSTVWRTGTKGNNRIISLKLFAIESPYFLLQSTRRRFALSLFYFQLLCVPASFSQRSFTSFSNLSDFNLGYRPSGLAVGTGARSTVEIAVVVHEQPSICLYEISNAGQLMPPEILNTQRSAGYITSADLNNDGTSEYVTLSSDGLWCSIIRRTPQGNTVVEYQLNAPSRGLVVADLNNDKIKDIVLFGKNSAGALTLLGRSNGTFRSGPLLFADISISDMAATDINRDGVVDLLVLNWLSEELTIFMGISRLVYSEQITVPLSSEPAHIAISQVGVDRSFRLAITFPASRETQVFSGNSLGDYRLMTRVDCGRNASGVQLTHVNTDQYLDLVVRTARGIEVACGGPSGSFAAPTLFGISSSASDWLLADLDEDGNKDCVLLDRQGEKLLVLANSDHNGTIEWPDEYAVGLDPRGLVLEDLNGDGRQDIAVANYGSGSISLLLNTGNGRFAGQQGIMLSEKPTSVHRVGGMPSRNKFLVASHSSTDRVTVITLQDEIHRARTFTVPTGSDPSTVLAKLDSSGLEFVVRYTNAKDRSYVFSSFKQISPKQFVERSLRASVSTKILTMSIDEGASPGSFELLFAQHDKSSGRTTISASTSEKGLLFGATKALFSYSDSLSVTKFVLGAYLNPDAFKDVIVTLGAPQNSLGIWYGTVRPFSRDSVAWIANVQPINEDAMTLSDVNNDGTTDIVWLDGLRRAIVVSYGSAGGFGSPVSVLQATGVSSFRLGSLRQQGVTDLVCTNPAKGTVSIVFAPFLR